MLSMQKAKIGVIGLGYVGLPLVVEIGKAKIDVLGFDIDQTKINNLKKGLSHIEDISNEEVQSIKNHFTPTNDFARLKEVNFIIIAVPTPLRKTKDPDLSYIQAAIEQIDNYMQIPSVIVLESTTYPGTTNELITKRFIEKGHKLGKDFHVAFSPERVDPGNEKWKIKNTPKVIGGATKDCKNIVKSVYSRFIDTVVTVDSPEEAEMVKLLENTYRAVNIALVNELLMMSNRMDINFWNVIKGASTKPFGFQKFSPGPGIGGHCIPLDPQYLSWRAKQYSFYNRFIELASDINENMPNFVIQRAMHVLNESGIALSKSKVLLLGLAYKKDVSDLRESPAIAITEQLKSLKAHVYGCDPLVSSDAIDGMLKIESLSIENVLKENFDLCILITNHSVFTKDWLIKNCKRLLDTRGVFDPAEHPGNNLL
jgi:UDP-N-acetyl-D-glucosamine dehydrogenase